VKGILSFLFVFTKSVPAASLLGTGISRFQISVYGNLSSLLFLEQNCLLVFCLRFILFAYHSPIRFHVSLFSSQRKLDAIPPPFLSRRLLGWNDKVFHEFISSLTLNRTWDPLQAFHPHFHRSTLSFAAPFALAFVSS
jgi:hypothetical protein